MTAMKFGSIWQRPAHTGPSVIWVLGAEGQVGHAFVKVLGHHPNLKTFDRAEWDITCDSLTDRMLSSESTPTILVNCAAFTDVDCCEEQPDLALAVNAHAVSRLAAACEKHSITFVHISSDYIFDGTCEQPIRESMHPHPLGAYGRSKFEGERLTWENMPSGNFIIVRTSWVFSDYPGNFVTWVIQRLQQSKETIRAVQDQVGGPTYAPDLVHAILRILEARTGGWIHFRNSGTVTRFEQARFIAESIHVDPARVLPVKRDAMPWSAARPAYSVLAVDRYCHLMGDQPRPWTDGLHETLRQLSIHDKSPKLQHIQGENP